MSSQNIRSSEYNAYLNKEGDNAGAQRKKETEEIDRTKTSEKPAQLKFLEKH